MVLNLDTLRFSLLGPFCCASWCTNFSKPNGQTRWEWSGLRFTPHSPARWATGVGRLLVDLCQLSLHQVRLIQLRLPVPQASRTWGSLSSRKHPRVYPTVTHQRGLAQRYHSPTHAVRAAGGGGPHSFPEDDMPSSSDEDRGGGKRLSNTPTRWLY